SASALSTTGTITSRWRREASSGTTPPYGAWMASWEATTLERTRRPPASTAAAVSSHELSIPSTTIRRPFTRVARAAPDSKGDAAECLLPRPGIALDARVEATAAGLGLGGSVPDAAAR